MPDEPTAEPSLLEESSATPEADPAAEPPAEVEDEGSLLGGEPTTDPAEGDEVPEFGLDEVTGEALNLPEGWEADPEALAPFLEDINTAGSRQEVAERMLARFAQVQERAQTELASEWSGFQKRMRDEVKAHPEYGGDNMEASLATARELIESYSENAAELKALLSMTGAGNSVHMVAFLNKLAAQLPREGKPVNGTPATTSPSRAERLFGS